MSEERKTEFLYVYDHHYAITKLIKELVGLLHDMKYVYDMEQDEGEIEKRRMFVLLYIRLTRDVGNDRWGVWNVLSTVEDEIKNIKYDQLWRPVSQLLSAISQSKAIIDDPNWRISMGYLKSPEDLRTMMANYDPGNLQDPVNITVQQGAFLSAFCKTDSSYMFEKVRKVFDNPQGNHELLMEADVLGDTGFPSLGRREEFYGTNTMKFQRIEVNIHCSDQATQELKRQLRQLEDENQRLQTEMQALLRNAEEQRMAHERREAELRHECGQLSVRVQELQNAQAPPTHDSTMFASRHSDGPLTISNISNSSAVHEEFNQMGESLKKIQEQVKRLSKILNNE